MQAMIRASAIVLKKKQCLLPVMVASHTLPSLELSLDSRYLHILGVSDPELYWCHYRDKKNHLKIRIPVQVFSFLLSFTSPLSPLKYNSVFMQRFHRRYSEKTWFGLQPYPWIQHQSALRCSFSIRKKRKPFPTHSSDKIALFLKVNWVGCEGKGGTTDEMWPFRTRQCNFDLGDKGVWVVLLFVMGFENVLHSLNSLQHGDPEVAVSLRVRSEVFPAAAAIQVSSCFGHPPCRDQKSLFLWLKTFLYQGPWLWPRPSDRCGTHVGTAGGSRPLGEVPSGQAWGEGISMLGCHPQIRHRSALAV